MMGKFLNNSNMRGKLFAVELSGSTFTIRLKIFAISADTQPAITRKRKLGMANTGSDGIRTANKMAVSHKNPFTNSIPASNTSNALIPSCNVCWSICSSVVFSWILVSMRWPKRTAMARMNVDVIMSSTS